MYSVTIRDKFLPPSVKHEENKRLLFGSRYSAHVFFFFFFFFMGGGGGLGRGIFRQENVVVNEIVLTIHQNHRKYSPRSRESRTINFLLT